MAHHGATFILQIDTDNDAFAGDHLRPEPAPEIARILRKVAAEIEARGVPRQDSIRDINGNTVGFYVHKRVKAVEQGGLV